MRLEEYERLLKKENLLDFDMLLLKARDLMLHVDEIAAPVRTRWASVLVMMAAFSSAAAALITRATVFRRAGTSMTVPQCRARRSGARRAPRLRPQASDAL
jgi:hypothetical protein